MKWRHNKTPPAPAFINGGRSLRSARSSRGFPLLLLLRPPQTTTTQCRWRPAFPARPSSPLAAAASSHLSLPMPPLSGASRAAGPSAASGRPCPFGPRRAPPWAAPPTPRWTPSRGASCSGTSPCSFLFEYRWLTPEKIVNFGCFLVLFSWGLWAPIILIHGVVRLIAYKFWSLDRTEALCRWIRGYNG